MWKMWVAGNKSGHGAIHRHSPSTGDYMASIALLTGFDNGKSPLPRAKDEQGLRLRHSSAEATPDLSMTMVTEMPEGLYQDWHPASRRQLLIVL